MPRLPFDVRTVGVHGIPLPLATKLGNSVSSLRRATISPEHELELQGARSEHIRSKLNDAHRAGQQFRRRVQLPLAAIGILGMVVAIGVGVFSVVYKGPIILSAALIMVGPSFLFLALSLTPVETHLVKLGIVLSIVVEIFFAAVIQGPVIMHTEETFDRVMAGGSLSDKCTLSYGTLLYDADLRQVPCWYLVAKNTIAFVISLMCVVQAARLALSLRACVPGRQRLDNLWLIGGETIFVAGLVFSVGLILGAAANAIHFQTREAHLYWIPEIVNAVWMSSFGIFLLRDRYRRYILAWFMSRSEAATTAVGLAALLGRKPASEVQARAQALFRFVTLDLVTYEDMEDSNPNAALYGLSKPASMGGVDAFVSHSWRDDPEHKWMALQEWRAQFKIEHQREPRVWLDKVRHHCVSLGAFWPRLRAAFEPLARI
ncbi:hypothetical protein T492DRAFT_1139811 [Pavlovales sp. CCMP2436]|nr:hypothetical protein T492DRAFT_1139811 [Pavlovales sp. CCMP2436]